MIDMHTHWRPVEFLDALRKRDKEPRILKNDQGVEVLRMRGNPDMTLDQAFDTADYHLSKMQRQDVSVSVLSLLGAFCWIEARPLEEAIPLCRLYNDSISKLCQQHPGRFLAYAATPLRDMKAAAAEFDRAMSLPGIVGVQVPADGFATRKAAEQMRPMLEVAHKRKAIVFIHYGGLPDQPFPHLPGDVDNARRRNGTLDMQANLSAAMVTLCMTDILDDYPDAMVHVHNLGGNIPYEMERMDHRCLLDTPDEELPSKRFRAAKVFVDCNSFGPHAIEAGLRAYGPDRIICGTDGTEFGCEWTNKALKDAQIPQDVRDKILEGNARHMLARTGKLAQDQKLAA